MALSRAEALEYLELPIGADPDSIRTSYKRLAQKWLPDKHANSSVSKERFRQISLAYKRLNINNEYASVNEVEMYETYNRVVQQQKHPVYSNGCNMSSSEDDSDIESDQDDLLSHILNTKHNKQKIKQNGLNNNNIRKPRLTAEEIDRNAKELITEEEREKKKAEKRRAKKKRQREKKRLEKTDDKESDTNKLKSKENGIPGLSNSKKDKKINDSSGSEAEDFDRTAAFFTQVKSKKNKSSAAGGGVAGSIGVNSETIISSNTISSSSRPARGVTIDATNATKANGLPDEKVDDLILRSRQLAIEGNKNASLGQYTDAIELFTDAIKLDPRDFRFFGNRSYCFDRIQQYDRALKDAEKAISLSSEWPKGHFRKGRALAGLKLYPSAEQAFMQVLKLDKSCEDAMTELIRVRTYQLTEMGFTIAQAEQAIKQYGTVQAALDSLLASVAETSLGNEIYESDDEDYSTINSHPATTQQSQYIQQQQHISSIHQIAPRLSQQHTPKPATNTSHTTNGIPPMQPIIRVMRSGDTKMDPVNSDGSTALWVGNVLPDVSQTKLLQLFQKYGTVTSIKMLPEKYCAFINFKTKENASRAMKYLQDQDCNGQRLLIKFPDHPVTGGSSSSTSSSSSSSSSGAAVRKGSEPAPRQQAIKSSKNSNPGATLLIKKNPALSSILLTSAVAESSPKITPETNNNNQEKNSGPVNGDECYFWRTTGCQFGKTCHYKHIVAHKGIDKKPWQKSKEKV